jgi:hypothetical protein
MPMRGPHFTCFTSTEVHILTHEEVCGRCSDFHLRMAAVLVTIALGTSAYVRIRPHTSAYVRIRQHTSAYVSIRQHTSAYVGMLVITLVITAFGTSAYVSMRQHTSAYVSMLVPRA